MLESSHGQTLTSHSEPADHLVRISVVSPVEIDAHLSTHITTGIDTTASVLWRFPLVRHSLDRRLPG